MDLSDSDEFECTNCGHISDIENSVKVGSELFCEECADEIQRRDEKNGLYPDRWNDCN
jgi:predicted nucleic acid-binding Zn ribbon protein